MRARKTLVRCTMLLVAVMLILTAAPAAAQLWVGPAALEVKAEDHQGKAAAGAEVRLEYRALEPPDGPAPVRTDERGRAVVGPLAEGLWHLEVSREGFMTYVAEIEVRRDGKPELVNAAQHNVPGAVHSMRVRLSRSREVPRAPQIAEAPPSRPAPPPAAPPAAQPAPAPRPTPSTPPPATPAPTPPAATPAPVAPAPTPSTQPSPTPSAPAPAPPPAPAPRPSTPPAPAPEQRPAPSPAPQQVPPPAPTERPAAPPTPQETPPPAPSAPRPAAPPAERPPSPQPSPAPRPAPPAPAPQASPTPAPAPTPSAPPSAVPAPSAPAAAPAVPAPAAPPSPVRHRSFEDRTCFECKPGEASLSIEAVVGAGGGCGAGVRELLDGAVAAGVPASLPAGCGVLRVALPAGSRYTGYRYEVQEGGESFDCRAGEDCSVGASRWPLDPALRRSPEGATVAAAFENRAADRERRAVLTVYYTGGVRR